MTIDGRMMKKEVLLTLTSSIWTLKMKMAMLKAKLQQETTKSWES